MSGPRIYELSRELSVANKDVMDFLQSKQISFKSHSSSVDIADAQLVRKYFNAKRQAEAAAVTAEKAAKEPAKAGAKAKAGVEAAAPVAAPKPVQPPPPPPPKAAGPSPVPLPTRPPFVHERRVAPPPTPRRALVVARPLVARREVAPLARPVEAKPVEYPHRKVTVSEGVTVKEFAEKINVKAKDVLKKLLDRGIFVSINHSMDCRMIDVVSPDFNVEVETVSFEEAMHIEAEQALETGKLVLRPPVVTIMGHVNHGKTSLLDAIRATNVAGEEAGGITQRIGAYHVSIKGRAIVFLDTPGHEAFTKMRARGSRVTDIVVLVVAADDGVMPQTVEAIHHARAANVPIIVAINKIDKAGADVGSVKRELADQELVPEEWGGQAVMVEVSAKQKINLDGLLEMILLVADMAELKAHPERGAVGTVLEARLDKGRGPVSTVLVQNGSLRVGDNVLVGATYGKVRAMIDDEGVRVRKAGPSTAVEVLGIMDVPQPGDHLQAVEDIAKARQIGAFRQTQIRESRMVKTTRLTLDHLYQQIKEGRMKELPLILKADVQGSVEVLAATLNKLSTEKVRLRILHSGVGGITETDVLLASASNAIIIGFNVRPERKAVELARLEEVDIRLYTVIYHITTDITNAMLGLLEPAIKETYLGTAVVRNTFKVPKFGTVAGCLVNDGKVLRNADCRVVRDNVVVFEGRIGSLKRFKEDVSEVRNPLECGIGIERFGDVKVGDHIEVFTKEKVKQELTDAK